MAIVLMMAMKPAMMMHMMIAPMMIMMATGLGFRV